jgi:hypothetical protein
VLAAAGWARHYPAQWAVRQVRRHPPLFNAADLLLRQYGRIRSSLRPPPALPLPALPPPALPPPAL